MIRILAFVCFVLFPASAMAGSSCTSYGNTSYCSDGTSYTTYGNTTYGSDGSSYTTYGNTTYGSDGRSYSRYGNTTYGSDGTSYSTYGNTTYGSDGSSHSTYGNTTYSTGGKYIGRYDRNEDKEDDGLFDKDTSKSYDDTLHTPSYEQTASNDDSDRDTGNRNIGLGSLFGQDDVLFLPE